MQSSSRGGARVIWLVLHTTEGIMRAADLRAWASWPGSSHAANDETGVLLSGAADGFVDYDRAAWTLRNGNPLSDNLEQCGWARWSRAEWLSRPKLLDTSAKWLADRHKARPWIPLVKLSPAEVAARKPGVIGHNDYSVGTGDGTHWDPGPGFPWDVVLAQARDYVGGIQFDPILSEEDDPMIVSIAPGQADVIALPKAPEGKSVHVRIACDEPGGGVNVRVAVGWDRDKWAPLKNLDKMDGYTGWIFNGVANEWSLPANNQVLSVRHLGSRAPLGVTVQIR